MATDTRLSSGIAQQYSPIHQDNNLSEIRVELEDLGSNENKELSDLWNLVSDLVSSHPETHLHPWDELSDSSPLNVIPEETASECAHFSRSAAPSPPPPDTGPSKIQTSPSTPVLQRQGSDLPGSSWSDRSEFISSTPWSDRSEFISSSRTLIETQKITTSQQNLESNISPISSHYAENPLKETWIMSHSWLSVSDASDTLFTNAESLFADNRYQSGLATTDIALRSTDPFGIPDDAMEMSTPLPSGSQILHGCLATPGTIAAARAINLHLLKSCALLASESPDQALECANTALELSEKKKIYYMASKSQLYRGLALMRLERWRDASAAFTRAANVRGWAMKVPALKKEADRRLQEALGSEAK